MSRQERTFFVCQQCGYQAVKWLGRCPDCGQWDTLAEEVRRAADPCVPGRTSKQAQPLGRLAGSAEDRLKTGIFEFDRTLGGGIVPGSVVLIGGEPGIGKSTLLLQALARLAAAGHAALYVSGEESPQQIKLRADRLGLDGEGLHVLAATCLEDLLAPIETLNPHVLAVDSIQTLYSENLSSAPGSVSQVREVAARLLKLAKEKAVPLLLVGHVTKDGSLAGPKVLEHLVDTVLSFEGDGGHAFRILRAVKNRFGSTNEIGVFEMKDAGLAAVGNPSRMFLAERPQDVPGSAVIPCVEGTRPVLVEIQALVSRCAVGIPRRTAIGVDGQRLALLVAVLSKRLGLQLGDQDVFVNVTGGLKVEEPAADLGIVAAMLSSFLERTIAPEVAVFGEVGLAGEVRAVHQAELRLKEAHSLGFVSGLVPQGSLKGLKTPPGMQVAGIESVQGLYDHLFGR